MVDQARFGGLTALDTRRVVYGAERRAILTHSPELHAKPGPRVRRHHPGQGRQETRRAGRHPGPRQDPPPTRQKVEAEIEAITRKPWVRRVITWQLDGDQPKDLRLAWGIDPPPAPPWKRNCSASTC